MITFPNTRIEYGDDFITPQRIDGLLILFETPDKGKIRSHLMQCTIEEVEQVDEGVNVRYIKTQSIPAASVSFSDTDFEGNNILQELHAYYLAELQKFNPGIELTNTLAK